MGRVTIPIFDFPTYYPQVHCKPIYPDIFNIYKVNMLQ